MRNLLVRNPRPRTSSLQLWRLRSRRRSHNARKGDRQRLPKPCDVERLSTYCEKGIAMVTGPHAARYRVMSPATLLTRRDRRRRRFALRSDADVDHSRPGLTMSGVTSLAADRRDENVGAASVSAEVFGCEWSRVHGWHVLGEEQRVHWLADACCGRSRRPPSPLLQLLRRHSVSITITPEGVVDEKCSPRQAGILYAASVDAVLRRILDARAPSGAELDEDSILPSSAMRSRITLSAVSDGEAVIARVDPSLVRRLVLRPDVDV